MTAGLPAWAAVSPDRPSSAPTRVVLLAGPSGCGKSYIARDSGLPIVALDGFYCDATEPHMPRSADGQVDWEDPASWDGAAALAALTTLCRDGEVDVPTYSFARSAVVGHHVLRTDGAPVVVAEGIFAAELVAPLRRYAASGEINNRVKDAGGVGKLKVSVEFTNPAVAYKVTYVIQPGRLDWKVSKA